MMMSYLDEAVEACESLLVLENDSTKEHDTNGQVQSWTQACQTVGNILSSMGFVEESYPWRSMALDLTPNRAKFYAESGRVYSQCEVWDKALYFCQRTLEHQPDNVGIRRQIAKIHNRLGNYRQESQTLDELLSLKPEQATAEGHCQLGRVLENQGQLQAAVNAYERAIAQDKRYVAAYYALGELWILSAQQSKAIALLKTLIGVINTDLETKSADSAPADSAPVQSELGTAELGMAHYRLGRVYRTSGQLENAVEQFRQALQFDDHLHWAYMGLLNTLMQMQRWDEVIEPCKKLTHKAQEYPWIYTFMGNAYAKKKAWELAAAAHQQAFKINGWWQCAERDYRYHQTWFAESIPLWQTHLSEAISSAAVRAPAQALSLGSQDEAALCWLVDQVLSQSNDRLVCITPQVRESLTLNAAKLEQSDKLMFETGDPLKRLTDLQQLSDQFAESPFDAILVQSERKDADYLQSLLSAAWARLKANGVLLVQNCQWQHPTDPQQSALVGINAFIASAGDQLAVLHKTHQIIIRKIGAAPIHNPDSHGSDSQTPSIHGLNDIQESLNA